MEEIIGMTTINIFLTSVIMMASAWWLSLTIRTAQTLAQRQSMTNDFTNTLLKGSERSNHAHEHGINRRTS
jgi:hypothetical protein